MGDVMTVPEFPLMYGDPTAFEVVGRGRDMLEACLAVGLRACGHDRVSSWFPHKQTDPAAALALCWTQVTTAQDFMSPPTPSVLADQVWGWLEARPRQVWGEAPDTDGSVAHGWRMWAPSWGGFGGVQHAVALVVAPQWLVYGK
jgi:hypothetical protein